MVESPQYAMLVTLSFDNSATGAAAWGSAEESAIFSRLQKEFASQFELFFPDNLAPKTIVVIPSLTLGQEVLAKVGGRFTTKKDCYAC